MEIAKLVKTALEEARMLILGAQILLGFEFRWVFRNGFTALPVHARYLSGVALLLMIITVALLIAPETYHHYVEYNADTGRFHQLISRMAGCSLLPFALSRGVSLFIHRGSNRRPAGRDNCWLLLSLSWAELLVRAAILAQPSNRSQGAGDDCP